MFEVQQYMTIDELKKALEFDADNFRHVERIPEERAQGWIEKNPDIYTVLKYGDELVGYISFMPLKKKYYKKYRIGEIGDHEVLPEYIEVYRKGRAHYCLFMSIIIKEEFRDGTAVRVLMGGLYEKIDNLKKNGVKVKRVVADAITGDGEKLFNRLGFKEIGISKSGVLFEGLFEGR